MLFLFYQSFEKTERSDVSALQAIPQSAALIFETDEVGELWRDLSTESLVWNELLKTDLFFRLNELGSNLDSMYVNYSDLRTMLSDQPMVVSVHEEGAKRFNYLVAVPTRTDADEAALVEGVKKLLRINETAKTEDYDGQTIYTFPFKLIDDEIHFYIEDGLLVMGLSDVLIEESIRAVQQDASVLRDRDFQAVRSTRGKQARATVYVNYKTGKNILANFLKSENQDLDLFREPYAEWSALDLGLKASHVTLNGFAMAKDSTDAWLSASRNLEPNRIHVFDFMPSQTAYFAYFGYGDFKTYQDQRSEIRESSGGKYSFEKKLKAYDEKCSCNMKDKAAGWIGSQAVSFITEPVSEEYTQNHFVIFEAEKPEQAWINLKELNQIFDSSKEGDSYKGYEFIHVPMGSFYADILGDAFLGIEDPYVTRIEDMIVMAKSVNALRNIIDARYKGATLAADEKFSEVREQFSNEPQVLIYSSLARSPFIYTNLLQDEYANAISERTEVLRKFQAFIYEASFFRDELFYNNVYLKHSPEYQQETNALWEIKLPADLIGKPQFVENHYTGAYEILVQDAANKLHLISNTGKLMWSRPLDGPILGEVEQVDLYKNNKLQLLFNTAGKIYLVDRNGNDVESFPVSLKPKASGPIGIADYDNSRDYRIFVALEGGKTQLYDGTGKLVKGWEFVDNGATINLPLRHIRIKSKDYIMAITNAGKVHLLNRKGNTRHKVSNLIEKGLDQEPVLTLGNRIGRSALRYVDEDGNAFVFGFDDRFEKLQLVDEKVDAYAYLDLDGNDESDWVVKTNRGILAFTASGDQLFSLETKGQGMMQAFDFAKPLLVFVDQSKEQVYLYNGAGELKSGFPLYGSSEVAIGDMNKDGHLNLITLGEGGFVYAYTIED